MRSIRIGAGQGMYGDSQDAAKVVVERGNIQYICLESLAELTMSVLQKDKQRKNTGYPRDIEPILRKILKECKEKNIKIISNAGGVNPHAVCKEIFKISKELGIENLRIALVTGDDILDRVKILQFEGEDFRELYSGEILGNLVDRVGFSNVYLGCEPIVEALAKDVDLVLTGRVADASLFLAPLVHEFNWGFDELDKLAQGMVMGHLLECGMQSTGGNFSGDWWNIPDPWNYGYPIAEVFEDGSFIVQKPEGTGGKVSVETIKEQLLYEVHDPGNYLTPDVVVDFTTLSLEEIGVNKVLIKGATGKPRPEKLKVVMGYEEGWLAEGRLMYSWPNALQKASRAAQMITKRMEYLGLEATDRQIDYIGLDSLHGHLSELPPYDNINEVMLRYACAFDDLKDANRFLREIPPLGLNGPTVTLGSRGLIKPSRIQRLWSSLINREKIEVRVEVLDGKQTEEEVTRL